MLLKELADELGISLSVALAGFAGGVVSIFVAPRSSLWEVFGSIIVGLLTAVYLGGWFVRYTGASELGTGFIVGLCGMVICRGIMGAVQRINFFSSTKGE